MSQQRTALLTCQTGRHPPVQLECSDYLVRGIKLQGELQAYGQDLRQSGVYKGDCCSDVSSMLLLGLAQGPCPFSPFEVFVRQAT